MMTGPTPKPLAARCVVNPPPGFAGGREPADLGLPRKPTRGGWTMAYGIVLVFEGVGEDQYWAVNSALGIDRDGNGDYPVGLQHHSGGATATGWIVSEVWDLKASQEAFME